MMFISTETNPIRCLVCASLSDTRQAPPRAPSRRGSAANSEQVFQNGWSALRKLWKTRRGWNKEVRRVL